MPEPEPPESEMPQTVWKAQGEEQRTMKVVLTPEQLCALARSRERLGSRVRSASLVVIAAIATGFLYNLYTVDQPWIRIGMAWTLCLVVYLFGPAFENKVRQADASEPCARFLEREHEERRGHYLRIRNRLFLFVPGIVACWFGRTPTIIRGSSASGPAPPWLFLMSAIALVLVWFAFGKAAQKAARDRDEIRRSAGY
jgi:membrane protein implicated in regulation of membrane protease activity